MEAIANEKTFEMDPEQEASARSVRLLVSYDVHAKMRHHFTVIPNMHVWKTSWCSKPFSKVEVGKGGKKVLLEAKYDLCLYLRCRMCSKFQGNI